MFKTFSFGILLGVVLTGGLLYLVPVVDLHREASIISVRANGGNAETFHVNLPDDRILQGMPGPAAAAPAGLEWPDDPRLAGSSTELFKLRDRNDVVVGVASRIAGTVSGAGPIVEWTLHLPARGSLYLSMPQTADDAGVRNGRMLAGTREFAGMRGVVSEKVVAPDAGGGRIELVTALVGTAGDS